MIKRAVKSMAYALGYLLPYVVLWVVPSVLVFAPLIAWMKYQLDTEAENADIEKRWRTVLEENPHLLELAKKYPDDFPVDPYTITPHDEA
jgi:hypothetical protein